VTTRDLDLSEDGAIWQAIIAWSDARGYLTAGEPGTAAAKVDQAIRDAFASSSTVQQVGADALDAARYRFLKARLLGVDFDYCESGKAVLMFDWPQSSVSADCDWTIDEAIAYRPTVASSPKSDGGKGS
jgi:hypothetical protein